MNIRLAWTTSKQGQLRGDVHVVGVNIPIIIDQFTMNVKKFNHASVNSGNRQMQLSTHSLKTGQMTVFMMTGQFDGN